MLKTYLWFSQACEVLLDAGADLEAKSSSGATALMFASAAGYTDVVKLLLARGADANARVEVSHRPHTGIRWLAAYT